jgi:hypothetical protein
LSVREQEKRQRAAERKIQASVRAGEGAAEEAVRWAEKSRKSIEAEQRAADGRAAEASQQAERVVSRIEGR